jgi:cysteinyl-tRNA synthetase
MDVAQISVLVARRAEDRAMRSCAEADRIRAVLEAAGVIVEDRADGPMGRRVG